MAINIKKFRPLDKASLLKPAFKPTISKYAAQPVVPDLDKQIRRSGVDKNFTANDQDSVADHGNSNYEKISVDRWSLKSQSEDDL